MKTPAGSVTDSKGKGENMIDWHFKFDEVLFDVKTCYLWWGGCKIHNCSKLLTLSHKQQLMTSVDTAQLPPKKKKKNSIMILGVPARVQKC